VIADRWREVRPHGKIEHRMAKLREHAEAEEAYNE
jgi:hypothetical protein